MDCSTPSSWLESRMGQILDSRSKKGSLRIYQENPSTTHSTAELPGKANASRVAIDFSSNDYLGLARSREQKALVEQRYQSQLLLGSQGARNHHYRAEQPTLGATGSRLLSGDSTYARRLEQRLARWHNRPAALLCNSGYDANLSVLSCLPCDRFLYDEYAHNSLRMGMRLSRTFRDKQDEILGMFQHNNVDDLHNKLKALRSNSSARDRILIVVESVYSMDGDVAPLREMLNLAHKYGALVAVDEAHGLGIFGDDIATNTRGTGVLAQLHLEHHPALACSIHTFGKAAGCHGAVVCGSGTLRQYLWNYGWPLIYSTSLPLHSLVAIECSYETMTDTRGKVLRQYTNELVMFFRRLVEDRILKLHNNNIRSSNRMYLLPSTSPIQALVLPTNGNQACTEFCDRLWEHSGQTIKLYPIKSPTVPRGLERIRIIIHGHNTREEVNKLVDYMVLTLQHMRFILPPSSVRRRRDNTATAEKAAMLLSRL